MRQQIGKELDFVNLINTSTSTEVTIDGSSLTSGNYELVLESFDEVSTV